MPKQYQLHLKGFVGGFDFDADYVDYILGKHKDSEVDVLIDSFGGKVSTALSISSAFKRHGNVHAHFVGMNASAATIASLGAKVITMDASAMYLVHKCSMDFFEWGSMNSDDLASLIANVEKQKKDLDKLDANIAEMYATKCKKDAKALLDLMKQGGWLTAKEALAWGFVDELTDEADDEKPVLTDTMAQALAQAGIPLPPTMADCKTSDRSRLSKLFQSLAAFFHPGTATTQEESNPSSPLDQHHSPTNNSSTPTTQHSTPMNKVFKHICAILACEALTSTEGKVILTDAQLDSIEAAADKSATDLQSANDKLKAANTEITNLKAEIDKLKKEPGDETHNVLDESHTPPKVEKTEVQDFVDTAVQARALYDLLP